MATLWRDSGGATAIEFALVAPLLFGLLFGGVEAGRLLFLASALDHAVGQSARCAAIDPEGCASPAAAAQAIEASLAGFSAPMTVGPDSVVVARVACGFEIRAQIPYPPLLLPDFGISLAASACARVA